MPPKVDGGGEPVDVGDDGRAGGGQSRHRFKKCVGKAHIREIQVHRHRSHSGKRQPQHQDEGEAVARAQFAPEPEGGEPDDARAGKGNGRGGGEGGVRTVRKGVGEGGGYQQDKGKQHTQSGEDVGDGQDFVHSGAVRYFAKLFQSMPPAAWTWVISSVSRLTAVSCPPHSAPVSSEMTLSAFV